MADDTPACGTCSPGPGLASPRTADAAPVTETADAMVPLALTREVRAGGRPVVAIGGELDIVTAEEAFVYVRDVIDQGAGLVDVDIAGLTFCDASGLAGMARMVRHAEYAGCQLRLIAIPPLVLKIMRITGFDRWHLGLAAASPEEAAPARPAPSKVSA